MNNIRLIQIEPTTRCNFTCSFCCGRHMKQVDMDMDNFKIIIDKLDKLEHIELQGEGEPFLHPQLYEMIKYAKRKDIQVSTITNGSLFSRNNIIKILESGIDSINVSIESPNFEEFKKIRGGNLEHVKEGIKSLITERNERNLRQPIVGFAVTVIKETCQMLKSIFDLYSRLDMDGGISIQVLNKTMDYASQYSDKTLEQIVSEEEYALVMRDYFRMLRKIKVNNERQHFFSKMEEISKINSMKPNYCTWLENALYVNAEGFVTTCVYIKDTERFALGQIGKESINEIIHKRDIIRDKLRKYSIDDVCIRTDCGIVNNLKKSNKS